MVWAAWWLPGARGLERFLVVTTAATATLLVVAQVAGLAGRFRIVPVLLGCAAVAVLGRAVPRRRRAAATSAPTPPPDPDGEPRWLRAAVASLLGAGAVQWLVAVVPTLRGGITDIDGLHYHLTHAAQYVQTGRLLPLRFVETGHPSPYYPSNDETLRAVGVLATGTDLTGLLVNGTAAVVVLASAFVLGRRFGRPWTATASTAVLLAGPLYGARYAGWAHVDWTAIAFLAVAAALLVTREGHGGATVLAGVALGIAAGTKVTVGPAVACLAFAAVAMAGRGHRADRAVRLVVPAVVVGGWWYVRNLVTVGTPLPGLPLFGGPPALLAEEDQAVVDYLTDPAVVAEWYLPGLRLFFGWGWPGLLGLLGIGLLVAVVRGRGWVRGLGLLGLATGAAYLVTPTTALGPDGQPVLFTANLRYAWPALLLAGWATAVAVRHHAVGVLFCLVGAIGLLEPRAWMGIGPAAAGAGALAALAAAGAVAGGVSRRAWQVAAATVAAASLLLLFGPIRATYESNRYRHPEATDIPGHAVLFAAAQEVRDTTVAVSGYPLTYPFLGPDLSNTLHVPGTFRHDGAYLPHTTCEGYRADLADAGATVAAALVGGPEPEPEEVRWLTTDPSASVLAQTSRGVVVRLDAPPDPTAC